MQAYAVWVPMTHATEKDVPEATRLLPDPRVRHFWDEGGFTLRVFAPVLGLPPGREAWDVYLIYKPGTRWEGDAPPVPDYWMHNLRHVESGPRFEREEFARQLERILAAAR